MNLTAVHWLLFHLGWREIIIVSNHRENDVQWLTQTLSDEGVQHVLVTGSEALSGKWVTDVVKTGVDSWRPLHFLLMCSVTCIMSALTQVQQRQKQVGTQSAFAVTSRWLLMTESRDILLRHLHQINMTLDNVAVLSYSHMHKQARCAQIPFAVHTWYGPYPRGHWTQVRTVSNHLCMKRRSAWPGQYRWTPAANSDQESDDFCNTDHECPGHSSLQRRMFPNAHGNFYARKIRVLVKEWLSYVRKDTRDGTVTWTGLYMDLLKEASKRLKFEYELIDATNDEWGSGTPDDPDRGYLGYVSRKEVDIGLTPFGMRSERLPLIDYPWPVLHTSVVMVYRKPEVLHNFRLPLGPLSTTVAICLAASLVFVSLHLFCLELCTAASESGLGKERVFFVNRERVLRLLTIWEIVVRTAGAVLLQEPSEQKLRSRGGRVLLWSWWMVSLVVTAAYSGTLTAFLSVSTQPLLFSRPEDLLTKSHSYTWWVFRDSSLYLLFQNSNISLHQRLWEGMQRFSLSDPSLKDTNEKDLAQRVRLQNFVLFEYKLSARVQFGDDCNIAVVDAGIGQTMGSLVLPKDSALLTLLSDVILRLQSNGVLSQWTDKWFPRATCPSPSGPEVMTLLHVRGVLLVLPVALGMALVVLAAEILYYKKAWQTRTEEETPCRDQPLRAMDHHLDPTNNGPPSSE